MWVLDAVLMHSQFHSGTVGHHHHHHLMQHLGLWQSNGQHFSHNAMEKLYLTQFPEINKLQAFVCFHILWFIWLFSQGKIMLNFRHSAFEMHFYFRNVINRKIQAHLINFPPRVRSLFCLQSLEVPVEHKFTLALRVLSVGCGGKTRFITRNKTERKTTYKWDSELIY